MSDAPPTGEIAGIIAAIVVGMAAIGKGIQWMLTYGERRAESRAEKLQRWDQELERREREFDSRLNAKLGQLEDENRKRAEEGQALRMAFELVASALRSISPGHSALNRAEQLLQAAFPLMPIVPPDMTTDLKTLDRKDLAATAAARRTGEPA